MLNPDSLLKLARAYSKATGLTLTGVGKRSCNNDKVFTRLAQGHSINLRTAEAAERWFVGNWPANAKWPKEIAGKPIATVPAFASRYAAPELRAAAERLNTQAARQRSRRQTAA